MWNLEKDPHLSSSIANVTLLDQAARSRAAAQPRSSGPSVQVPRLRQRVVPALGRLAPPEWRDEPDFDLDYHLRWAALPAPGSMRQLLDLTATFVGTPFDRTRPLWEFLVIEGLEDGRAAMIQKLHHAIADGEGEHPHVGAVHRRRARRHRADRPRSARARSRSRPASSRPPSTRSPTSSAAGSASPGAPPRAASACCATRRQIVGLAGDARRARAVGHAAGASCRTRPARPCGPQRSLRRRIEVLQVPMERGQGGRQGARRQPQRLLRGRRRPAAPAPTTARSASRSTSCASRCR